MQLTCIMVCRQVARVTWAVLAMAVRVEGVDDEGFDLCQVFPLRGCRLQVAGPIIDESTALGIQPHDRLQG